MNRFLALLLGITYHSLSVCCCSLKFQMELYSCIFQDLLSTALPPNTFSLKSFTAGCINYTFGSIIHNMIKNIHLSGQIYSMHGAYFQQSFVSFSCIVETFILSLLENYNFPSLFRSEGMREEYAHVSLHQLFPIVN